MTDVIKSQQKIASLNNATETFKNKILRRVDSADFKMPGEKN